MKKEIIYEENINELKEELNEFEISSSRIKKITEIVKHYIEIYHQVCDDPIVWLTIIEQACLNTGKIIDGNEMITISANKAVKMAILDQLNINIDKNDYEFKYDEEQNKYVYSR